MSERFMAIWSAYRVQIEIRRASKMLYFVVLIQPLLFLFIMTFMDRGQNAGTVANAVTGSVLMGIWSGMLFSAGMDVERERRQGTLESLLGAPASLLIVLVGKSLANSTLGIMTLAVSYLGSSLLFDTRFTIGNWPAFVLAIILTCISISALGLLIASGFTLSRQARVLTNIMELPIFFLSGIFFPLQLLPVWLRPLSWAFSLTWGADALHRAAGGSVDAVLGADLLLLIVLTAVYGGIAVWLYQKVERRARYDGTLGVY